MKKDAQFTLRFPTGLRRELQDIANHEGRSMAQICEAFLKDWAQRLIRSRVQDSLRRFLNKTA